jgi:hypothetical protein
MIIMISEKKAKSIAKRLRMVLRDLGVEVKHTACLELTSRLLGFDDWRHYCLRDPDASLSPFDEHLSGSDFAARDDFQLSVLVEAGLASVAREVLDRVNPTGSWSKASTEPGCETSIGNDAGRWSEALPPPTGS